MLGFAKKNGRPPVVFTKVELEQILTIIEEHYAAHKKLLDMCLNPPNTVELNEEMVEKLKTRIKYEEILIEDLIVLGNRVMDALDGMK